jgi:glycosyltransferase involved in cell wall biosynthesis
LVHFPVITQFVDANPMKIFVAGTRGLPDIPGGVEKHCQELYPRLVAMGHEVCLFTRSCYVTKKLNDWEGVKLLHTFAPRKKSLEAITHTLISIAKARFFNPDVIHIHAIGPSLMVPFARLLGMKVVTTNHGPDYDRQKWSRIAKFILRLGEKLGGIFSNEVIVISNIIAKIISDRCRRTTNLIYNGVPIPVKSKEIDYLEKAGIKPGNYLLAVARFVPEKGLHDLVKAFKEIKNDIQLVIAGDADHESEYSLNLKKMAAKDSRIVMTGYISGKKLNQVYSNALLFILPSYHEGLPICLLEAMSYGVPVLVSDIPANKEVQLQEERFFKCGDTIDLHRKLETLLEKKLTLVEQQKIREQIEQKYNWDLIAKQTIEVYSKALNGRGNP